ncbi:hypothetical protein GQ600_11548 [Phytophthora cactorum]|nr:hypothetical protein GQ600_11548 [Phytophthora cactorum]
MRIWRAFLAILIGLLGTCDAATVAASSPKTLAAGPMMTRESLIENTKRYLRKESVKNNEAIDEERGFKDVVEAARIAALKSNIPAWLVARKDSTEVIKILKMTYPYVDHKNWRY